MTDIDELDVNQFFRELQTKHEVLYEKAQDNCYVVCVPQASSLASVTISRTLIETHILKPSPYFKNQYITLSSQSKTVHLEENGKEFKTKDGFQEEQTIKILNEELGYNKDYKPYKILVIEAPLDSSLLRRKLPTQNGTTAGFATSVISFTECKQFLSSYAEYHRVMRQLDDSLKQFNTSYMVLKDYIDEAKQRLQSLSSEAVEDCYKCSKHSLWSDPRFKDVLGTSVESYVMGAVHQKVFTVLCEKFEKEDKVLFGKCKQLFDITPEELGVSPKLSCPLPKAVVELANLDGLKTPLEKIHCLKSTVDNATESIEKYIEENKPPPMSHYTEEAAPCLTSDDLIPILVTVISHAKCEHLSSNIFYIENFHWATDTKDRDNLSYCLVTFKAAVEFMKNTSFSNMQKKSKVKREISIEELMKASKTSSRSQPGRLPATGSSSRAGSSSNFDQQLQKISVLLEDSFKDKETTHQKELVPKSVFGGDIDQYRRVPQEAPRQFQENKKEQYGDFLASLKDDLFDADFGKQS